MPVVDLGYRPRKWQKECHAQRKRFSVYVLHRRAGKTELGIMELVDAALKFQRTLGMFVYIAPELKQGKTNVWDRLKLRLKPLIAVGAVQLNESETSVRFTHNDAKIRVFGGADPDALRGFHLDGIIIDEVAQAKPELWEEVIRPALADRGGWAIFIGTPKGLNLFSKLYFEADGKSDWHRAVYTCYDTEALPPDEIENIRLTSADDVFAREMLCDFSAAGDDQLMSLQEIEDAARRQYKPGEMDYAPVILGVDPARFGDDRSVILRRQGLQAFDPQVFHGIDNMQLAAKVAQAITDCKPDAVFVDVGNGSGVIDRLRQLGHDVIEINFGGKSSTPLYVNKRAEMWFTLRDWIREGGAIPAIQALKQDLAAPTYKYDVQNRLQLESKDEIKKRGLPSPDIGDALALTFAHPVAKKRLFPRSDARATQYNPLTEFDTFHTRTSRDYDPLA